MTDFITLYHLTNSNDLLRFLDPKYCQPCEGGQKEGLYFTNSLKYCKVMQDNMLFNHDRIMHGPFVTKVPLDMIQYPDWRIDTAINTEFIDNLADALRSFYKRYDPGKSKIDLTLHSHSAEWDPYMRHATCPDLYDINITALEFIGYNTFVYHTNPENNDIIKTKLSSSGFSQFGIVDTLTDFLCEKNPAFKNYYNNELQQTLKNTELSIKYCNPNYCIPVIYYYHHDEDVYSDAEPSKPLLFDYDLSDLTYQKQSFLKNLKKSLPSKSTPSTSTDTIYSLDSDLLSNRLIMVTAINMIAFFTFFTGAVTCNIWKYISPESYNKVKNSVIRVVKKTTNNIKTHTEGHDRTE